MFGNLDDMQNSGIQPYVPVLRPLRPSPSGEPLSPTDIKTRPVSSAAGTVHTSTLSGVASVSHTPLMLPRDKSQSRQNESRPSLRPRGQEVQVASSGPHNPALQPAANNNLHTPGADPHSLPPSGSSSSSIEAPLILPTEIGQALSYAPPEVQSSVISLFRSLFLRSGSGIQSREVTSMQTRSEVDSGLRLLNDAYGPPPEYTTH